MSKIPVTYKRTDLQSDQEVKWCPGCGDYTILASVQNFMAEMGISKEKICFVSQLQTFEIYCLLYIKVLLPE